MTTITGLKLREARAKFNTLQKEKEIEVSPHAVEDYPERNYTIEEVAEMVVQTKSIPTDCDHPYRGERFKLQCKDTSERTARFIISFELDENRDIILVISAGERKDGK